MSVMADPHFLSTLPTLAFGLTVGASYFWLALRRATDDTEVDLAIHLAAGIFWCTIAYTLRTLFWTLSSLDLLPFWATSHSGWLDIACNLIFAYGGYRAHLAIYLMLPAGRRMVVPPMLAWTETLYTVQYIRRLMTAIGRGMRRLFRLKAPPPAKYNRRHDDPKD